MEASTTTTEHNVREHPKDRPGARTKVFTGISVEEPPTEPLCSDPECTLWYCKNGHPEVDHQVWKAWRRREIAAVRQRLVPVLAQHLGVEPGALKIYYGDKVGCGCGCSPGWVIAEPRWTASRPNDIWVD